MVSRHLYGFRSRFQVSSSSDQSFDFGFELAFPDSVSDLHQSVDLGQGTSGCASRMIWAGSVGRDSVLPGPIDGDV